MATTLTAGDVAIIRTDHSGTDDFTFVLLADVDATTEISFTNIGVNGGQYGNGAGALITWTSGTALAAGTVITISEASSNTFATTGGGSTAFIGAQNASGFTIGSLGDQLIAFQGTYAANGAGMTELFGLHVDGDGSFTQAGWDATVNFIDSDSQLPPDLTPGTTAVALNGSGNNTNAIYTGPTTGSRATLLAAIADPTNWTTSTSTQTAPTGPFTITTASPPVVTPGGGSQTFSEATGTPVAVDAALTVSDSDSPTLVSATVSITANFQAGADVLAFTGSGATGNITGSYAAGTGVLTLSSAGGTATVAQWQAALRAVTYANSSDDPSTSARTISIAVSDGSEVSATQTTTVNVTAVNDAPTLTATGATAPFTEGGSPIDLFSGVAASTVEAGQTFSGLTLTVTNVTDGGSEILSVDGTSIGLANGSSGTTTTNSLTFSISVAGGTATLTLSGGTLSAAQLQTLVDALAYRNSSDDPTAGPRTVTLASVT
ncbi:beta strand repeat-containing protein, partial [Aurantimonas sp.]|uniref:beta strand repeat-containing protein n=1 Tax=Aurantimonas sp. TaxID=1872654 RepID=UPI003515977B